MPLINEVHTVTSDGVTVSKMVWRRFRLPAQGVVEAILNANPGLADLGQTIPLNHSVVFPLDTDQPDARRDVYKLWDER